MSTVARMPEADPLYAQPLSERPVYATGMLLDAQDFADEQTYHRVQLARAMAFLAGGGTLAGLRVTHQAATTGEHAVPEEIRVEPGLAVDRLGRLIELPRPACLRLPRWYDAQNAIDGGGTLKRSAYADLDRFLSARAIAEAAAVPERAVVADVFLRFVACPRGLTPSFAAGPFDALNAVSTSRVRDAYELLLIPRQGLENDYDGLPAAPGPAAVGDTEADTPERHAARRDALQNAVLDAYTVSGRSGSAGQLAPLPEQPNGLDPTAVFIARTLIPVAAGDDPPVRQGDAVLVDNWRRRLIPSASLLAQWIGV